MPITPISASSDVIMAPNNTREGAHLKWADDDVQSSAGPNFIPLVSDRTTPRGPGLCNSDASFCAYPGLSALPLKCFIAEEVFMIN